jgi:hypothetical protein
VFASQANSIVIGNSSNQNVYISGNCYASAFYATSDYRIKENVTSIPLDVNINNLNPILFKNKITRKNDIGFLEHEVKQYFPYLVDGEKDGQMLQSVNYTGLIGLIVKEIQDLKQENRLLKTRIELLENM